MTGKGTGAVRSDRSDRPGRAGARWGGRLIGVIVCALAVTWRVRVFFPEREVPRTRGRPGRIYSLWHGRMLCPAYHRRNQGAAVLVSRSRDGDILAGALGVLGYRAVRGSTSRGGAPALRRLLQALRAGRDVGIASDGPRGPALRVQPGIIHLASRSGSPVVPLVFGAARAKTFASWDRFCLPYPFARVALVFGRPVTVPPEAGADGIEAKRLELEREMLWALQAADAAAKGRPLPPEPVREPAGGESGRSQADRSSR